MAGEANFFFPKLEEFLPVFHINVPYAWGYTDLVEFLSRRVDHI